MKPNPMKDIPAPRTGGTYHVRNGKLVEGNPPAESADTPKTKQPAPADHSRKPSVKDHTS